MKKIVNFILVQLASVVTSIKPRWDAVMGQVQLKKIKNRGKDCYIYGAGTLIDSERITLGNGVQIGKNFYFAASGGIEIGSYSHLSRNITIYSRNHDYQSDALPYDKSFQYKSVKIGKCVWIGMNVNIVPGVTIGDGAVIGIGTTVSKDVPPGTILVGSGAREVGKRDPQHYTDLYEKGFFWAKNKLVVEKMPDKPYTKR